MYRIDGQTITFNSGCSYNFRNVIAEILDFEEVLVLRLGDEPSHLSNENVMGFDPKGKLLWQIPVRPQVTGQSPYVSLNRRHNVYVEAFNWNGYSVVMNPKTGEIITEGMIFGESQSRRVASTRLWM